MYKINKFAFKCIRQSQPWYQLMTLRIQIVSVCQWFLLPEKSKEYVETRFLHQRQHWIRNQHKFLALGTTIYQLLVMASLWSKATRGFEEKTSDILNKDFALTWGGIMIAGLGHSSLGLFQFSFGKILIFLEGKINASSTGRETISFVPPSNSFV